MLGRDLAQLKITGSIDFDLGDPEAGVKLDLARAYMDVGEPEGAHNILEEVLTAGSNAQKQIRAAPCCGEQR